MTKTHTQPVAWRVLNDFGHWYITQDKALADTYRDAENKDVQPLYLAAKPTAAPVETKHSPDECGRECQYYEYFEMLWRWFADESRNGAEDMRANRANGGLSADDFKQMLDDHEANLIPTEPQSSTDSEAFRDALEQLAAVARTAVSYVDYANYSKREREAQSWIRKKHEELLASVLPRPQNKTGAQ